MNFSKMQPIERLTETTTQFTKFLYNLYAARYKWTTPDFVPQEIPIKVLANSKYAAICADGGFYAATPCGIPDRFGNIKNWNITLFGGGIEKVVDGENAVIINNTFAEIADNDIIDRYAFLMAQTETSMLTALLNSRSTRFLQAETEAEKIGIKKAFSENENGEPVVLVTGKNRVDDFLDTKKAYEPYEFNDTNEVNRLQYLSQFSDDLLRRFVLMYGIDTCNINKQAQVSTEELHQYQQIAEILYNETFEIYSNAVEKANNLFEYKYKIEKNPLYDHESEVVTNGINNISEKETNTADDDISE